MRMSMCGLSDLGVHVDRRAALGHDLCVRAIRAVAAEEDLLAVTRLDRDLVVLGANLHRAGLRIDGQTVLALRPDYVALVVVEDRVACRQFARPVLRVLAAQRNKKIAPTTKAKSEHVRFFRRVRAEAMWIHP